MLASQMSTMIDVSIAFPNHRPRNIRHVRAMYDASRREQQKIGKYRTQAARNDSKFTPFVIDAYGRYTKASMTLISDIGKAIQEQTSGRIQASTFYDYTLRNVAIALQVGNARAIRGGLHRTRTSPLGRRPEGTGLVSHVLQPPRTTHTSAVAAGLPHAYSCTARPQPECRWEVRRSPLSRASPPSRGHVSSPLAKRPTAARRRLFSASARQRRVQHSTHSPDETTPVQYVVSMSTTRRRAMHIPVSPPPHRNMQPSDGTRLQTGLNLEALFQPSPSSTPPPTPSPTTRSVSVIRAA